MNHSLSNVYINLVDTSFYQFELASKFKKPEMVYFNHNLSKNLKFDFSKVNLANFLSGQGSNLQSTSYIALAYAGHQFGHFVPQLGDGRALLMGQFEGLDGKSYDLQLKGSGPTRFSRGGDGYSALGPAIREYVVSEAMFNLGVPTTRTLSVVSTGDLVFRQEGEVFGGISARVASSHIRIGTLEYYLFKRDYKSINSLISFVIQRHYPHLNNDKSEDRIYKLFSEIADRLCYLISCWMSVGFIHGVMNTDNMLLSGETIDYGPCAFMDEFSFNQVFSFIDKNGRYAYGNQPSILFWNLARLADCLIPLTDQTPEKAVEKFNEIINEKTKIFENFWYWQNLCKFGLLEGFVTKNQSITNLVTDFSFLIDINRFKSDKVDKLITSWYSFLQNHELDFTQSFRGLHEVELFQQKYLNDEVYNSFSIIYSELINQSGLSLSTIQKNILKNNPIYIPRNHILERVISKSYQNEFDELYELLKVIENPFSESAQFRTFALPPRPQEKIKNTFCGT